MYSPQTQYADGFTAGRPDQLEEAQMDVLGVTYDPDQGSSAGMDTHDQQAQLVSSVHKYKDASV